MNYEGKHALVLGLGESGLAMARWLARCGAAVRVADTRAEPARLPTLRETVPAAEFVAGNFDAALLEGIDFVALSPGLAPDKELADIVPAANAREIPLWGEIELFAQALAALRVAPAAVDVPADDAQADVVPADDVQADAVQADDVQGDPQLEAAPDAPSDLALDPALDAPQEAALDSTLDPSEDAVQDSVADESQDEISDAAADVAESASAIVPAIEPTAAPATGYAPKLIAITGTNGKTTVTSLTGLLCRRAGLKTQIAGNISPAALDVLREALDADDLPQAWVLELSSFQLHSTFSLQADAATVLNITQDHLDWHGGMAAYAADKARIFGSRTVRVLNRDDPEVMRMTTPLAPVVSFGRDEPEQGDCFGLLVENGMQWLAMAVPVEEEQKKRRKKDSQEITPVLVNRLMPADALKIRGQHNAMNALAALALCRAIGLPLAPLLHGLREYRGEPHRVELVSNIGGVDYYDDSKGTNVGATVAALNGLGAARGSDSKHLLLIAGGDGKGQSFAPLAEPVAKYVRAVFLIGADAPAIRAALEATDVELVDCVTLPEAVQAAAAKAHGGDEVLLSPACASFDMFSNYAHRAQVFIDAVRELALERGEIA